MSVKKDRPRRQRDESQSCQCPHSAYSTRTRKRGSTVLPAMVYPPTAFISTTHHTPSCTKRSPPHRPGQRIQGPSSGSARNPHVSAARARTHASTTAPAKAKVNVVAIVGGVLHAAVVLVLSRDRNTPSTDASERSTASTADVLIQKMTYHLPTALTELKDL